MTRIFISHSHKDGTTARQVSKLLLATLQGLQKDEMRITSHDEYRLQAAGNIEDQVKHDIQNCECVIGLISELSLQSKYVLCELGAAWGSDKVIFPLFVHGTGVQSLDGPLNRHLPVACDNYLQVSKMLKSLSTHLKLDLIKNYQQKAKIFSKHSLWPMSFWSSLSETISIVYGVKEFYSGTGNSKISLLDLESAHRLYEFLLRRGMKKTVRLFQTSIDGLRELHDHSSGDLVLVGGPAVNKAFAQHQTGSSERFRLKMGRLCQVDERQVYHVKFKHNNFGLSFKNPLAINDHTSADVIRDYGIITSRRINLPETNKRVIGIAGIKGNGTRAAADVLMDETGMSGWLNDLAGLKTASSMDMIVSAAASDNYLQKVELVSLYINGKQRPRPSAAEHSVACELPTACHSCLFGVPHPIKALVFDLDDTITDTYGTLIKQLESDAAKKIAAAGLHSSSEKLTEHLLNLRKIDPDNIDVRICEHLPGLSPRKLKEARRLRSLAFIDPPVDHLVLKEEVRSMLDHLRDRHITYLLTAGPKDFQNKKIKQLKIQDLFYQIEVQDSAQLRSTKKDYLRSLQSRYTSDSILIIGNRLDNEIKAGIELGMKTVWVKRGEGCEISMRDHDSPSFIITDILELPELLKTIEGNPHKYSN